MQENKRQNLVYVHMCFVLQRLYFMDIKIEAFSFCDQNRILLQFFTFHKQ